jgi:diguanylate cyclase (GGDEF)-like protein/PAS domain S-box-containing protein
MNQYSEAQRPATHQPSQDSEKPTSLIEAAPLAMIVHDLAGRIETWNRAAERMFGWTQAEVRGQPAPYHAVTGTDRYEQLRDRLLAGEVISGMETVLIRKDGRPIDVLVSAALMSDAAGRPASYLTIISDNTERKRAESNLQFVASHDPLTGLLNRAMFGERLQQAIAQAQRHDRKVALLFIDLDGFKLVNDTHGHAAGDVVLADLAHRLRECMREGDTLGRMGGDEFVVLIEGYAADAQLVEVARKILDTVAKPFLLREGACGVTASIGIATFPQDSRDAPELLKHADLAMYHAKEHGKNHFWFHSARMNTPQVDRGGMAGALRNALENGEMTLYYQPRMSVPGARALGAEALVRWLHPTQGLLTPAEFMPIAEQAGVVNALGDWIIRKACRQLRAWQQLGACDLRMAVNLSSGQFAQDDLIERLREAIQDSGIRATDLEIEITETILMRHAERAGKLLSQVKELGAHVVVDDFGTGHSSLCCLNRFPIDAIKIDRSLVAQVPRIADAAGLTRAVIAMGRSLGLVATAEGVETHSQYQFLMQHGCESMQGKYFCAPAPAAAVGRMLLQAPLHIAGFARSVPADAVSARGDAVAR